jgi:Spy/CpxP family protein refolding chaperone
MQDHRQVRRRRNSVDDSLFLNPMGKNKPMNAVLNITRHSLLTGCLVAACPPFAIASPPADAPFNAGGACAMSFHPPGPPMEPPFGTQHLPPYLMGVTLTEDQQDKVFAILHAAEPALREQEKAVRKARDGLRDLGRSAQFDAGSAATLAQALGKAESQLTLLRVRADHDVFSVLTAEQKTEISHLESQHESHREFLPPPDQPIPR